MRIAECPHCEICGVALRGGSPSGSREPWVAVIHRGKMTHEGFNVCGSRCEAAIQDLPRVQEAAKEIERMAAEEKRRDYVLSLMAKANEAGGAWTKYVECPTCLDTGYLGEGRHGEAKQRPCPKCNQGGAHG